MQLKYNPSEIPIRNEHNATTFIPSRFGQSGLRGQANDRFRRPAQTLRMQHNQFPVTNYRYLSEAEKLAWSQYAANFPIPCRFPGSGIVTGYQAFVKRNSYKLLNEYPVQSLMLSPVQADFQKDNLVFKIVRINDELRFYYETELRTSDIIFSVFVSYFYRSSAIYQRSQPRYMGYFINEFQEPVDFGLLYNHWCCTDPRNFAAPGWHVPEFAEWMQLVVELTGEIYSAGVLYSGGILKSKGLKGWFPVNNSLPRNVGFEAMGAGYRFFSLTDGAAFTRRGASGHLWATDINSAGNGRALFFAGAGIANGTSSLYRKTGSSIRLFADSPSIQPGQTGTYTGNDGKVYPTVRIGSNEVMAVSSFETKFRTGEDIPLVNPAPDWIALESAGYCNYNTAEIIYPGNPFIINENSPFIDITEPYMARFGILPEPGQYVRVRVVPYSKESAQFFDEIKETVKVYASV